MKKPALKVPLLIFPSDFSSFLHLFMLNFKFTQNMIYRFYEAAAPCDQ